MKRHKVPPKAKGTKPHNNLGGITMIKKTTIEVEALQKEWGNKPCNHDRGYGHEIDDVGCDCDCFCLQCGFRHTDPDYFKKQQNSDTTKPQEK